jgi:hypothetical protein
VALADEYVKRHLAEMTLQHFLSIFEVFGADLLRLWLIAFPRNIAGKALSIGDLLDAGDVPTWRTRATSPKPGRSPGWRSGSGSRSPNRTTVGCGNSCSG